MRCFSRGVSEDGEGGVEGEDNQPTGSASLLEHLKRRIRYQSGPLSVADFMSECLTNPETGFYQAQEAFGSAGSFITSPEISQMFGEMVGVWAAATWHAMGTPGRLRIVELGPGRGTLMADLLRGTKAFAGFSEAVEVHLVEVSSTLRRVQRESLECGTPLSCLEGGSTLDPGKSGISGAHVFWHRTFDDFCAEEPIEGRRESDLVPTLYIAHEYLDALPVHVLRRLPSGGWGEVLVDAPDDGLDVPSESGDTPPVELILPPSVGAAQPAGDAPDELRFVQSPRMTAAAALGLRQRQRDLEAEGKGGVLEGLSGLEVPLACMAVTERIAQRVAREGGAALLVDYGQDGPYEYSLTAIKDHRGVHPLHRPGQTDVSAWVDFSAARAAAKRGAESVLCFGPVTQGEFLDRLGIHARLQQLLLMCTSDEERRDLVSRCERITRGTYTPPPGSGGPEGPQPGLGETYRAMVIAHESLTEAPGFPAAAPEA
ncbi:unnamed protein product [Pedinophyceae sp. YPF-701]|nr:unnamed protein product [Pedinophyceae sp. YPF-701]